jgi:parallel beta-helix repeat protein
VYGGVPAQFNSSCSENAISFLWNFGDGGTSAVANPEHTFAETGNFTISLTVTNDAGKSHTATKMVNVMAPQFIEHSGSIEADETWAEGVHVITGDFFVNGATLTIQPGSIIKFKNSTGLYIGYYSGSSGATLIANGTAEKPILFTSDAGTKSAGDWDYIGFHDASSNQSSMQYCTVEYGGGYGENFGMVYVDGCAVSISNSTFRYSASHGLSLTEEAYFILFTNNTVELVGESAIRLYGNQAHTIGTGNTLVSVNGIAVVGDRMEQQTATWLKQTSAYVILGDLYVGAETGANLILKPGVEIRMGSGSGIYMGYYTSTYGTLTAEGTPAERIKFTSSSPDASKSPGDWDYIGFYEGAGNGSTMDYCDVAYGGGYSESFGMIYVTGSSLSLTNSTVTNSEYQGVSLEAESKFEACTGNSFGSNGTFSIEIYAKFAHTIGTGNSYNSDPGILVNGDEIDLPSVTWIKQGAPYICDGDVYLGSATGSKLTIQPGTTLKFTQGSGFYIGYYSGTFGIFEADGEAGNLITFTSSAPAGSEAPGDWYGIWFYDGTSNGTILDNCVVAFGGGYSDNSGNLCVLNQTAGVPVISNCQIRNSANWGIYLENNAAPTLTDNIFGNNASGDTNQ